MISSMNYAVVIPAYNEAATIHTIAKAALQYARYVIVVDDGSEDATFTEVVDLPVAVLRNTDNEGKAATLWRGMQYALSLGVDGVITLDADGQHAPADIPRLIALAERNRNRIAIAARTARRGAMPTTRYVANKIANFWISWACGYRVRDSQSGFRLYPARLLAQLNLPHDKRHGFVFESEILIEAARLGVTSVTLPIAAVYHAQMRRSHYRHIDSARITRMVAGKLISRWLYPRGFYAAFCRSAKIEEVEVSAD